MTKTLSSAQRRYRLRLMLMKTQRYGDRDECQSKHFEWAICALLCGQHWHEGLNYNEPWVNLGDVNSVVEDRWRQAWFKIENYRDEVGLELFAEDLKAALDHYSINGYLVWPEQWRLDAQRKRAHHITREID